jgi:cytochrome d ubiquinol oxidase subunit II
VAVVGLLIVGFAVLDGWDLGTGILLAVRRLAPMKERRVALNAVGPTWEGNQVWFITARRCDVRRVAARCMRRRSRGSTSR